MKDRNLFRNLSDKDLQECYKSCIRIQLGKQNEEEKFFAFVDEYIWDLEQISSTFRHLDDKEKFNRGVSIAERYLLRTMAGRYLNLYKIVGDAVEMFKDEV